MGDELWFAAQHDLEDVIAHYGESSSLLAHRLKPGASDSSGTIFSTARHINETASTTASDPGRHGSQ